MNRSFFVIAVIACLIAASFAFITADVPPYKNLKILKKDISKEELDSIMHFFSMSLGQRCGFCHVRNEAENTIDFASDENPHKDVARQMMRMTVKINKQYFDFRESKKEDLVETVTCYTCHHGKGEPEDKPKGETENGKGKFPPPPPGKFPPDSMRKDSGNNMPLMPSRPGDSTKFSKDTLRVQHQ